jgi:hypothetical protein
MNGPRLAYLLEPSTPLDAYVIAFVCSTLGIQPERLSAAEAEARPHLYYGDHPRPTSRIVIPKNAQHTVWSELLNGQLEGDALGPQLAFDVLSAIAAFLTDRVNADRPASAFDPHGSLHFAASFQAQHGIGHLPAVNRYVAALGQLIERQLAVKPRPLWPSGKRAVIALSHDVDRPYKYAVLRAVREGRWPRGRDLAYFSAKALRNLVRRLGDRHPDDFWLFEPLLASEAKLGLVSTFFFSVMPSYGHWGWHEDVYYDIAWPEFRPIFESIRARGFEIGLHASYNAHHALERFVFERQQLQQRSDAEVRGVRHHYWHVGQDVGRTLRWHARAGFAYDSSLAFDDHLGFRRNVALPYYPWDAQSGAPTSTLQIPTFCMDGNLFYQRGRTVPSAVDDILGHVATLKQVGGVGAIDWHVRMSYPGNREYADWGRAYQIVIQELAADRELWVTNLGAIQEWVTQRETAGLA